MTFTIPCSIFQINKYRSKQIRKTNHYYQCFQIQNHEIFIKCKFFYIPFLWNNTRTIYNKLFFTTYYNIVLTLFEFVQPLCETITVLTVFLVTTVEKGLT